MQLFLLQITFKQGFSYMKYPEYHSRAQVKRNSISIKHDIALNLFHDVVIQMV